MIIQSAYNTKYNPTFNYNQIIYLQWNTLIELLSHLVKLLFFKKKKLNKPLPLKLNRAIQKPPIVKLFIRVQFKF